MKIIKIEPGSIGEELELKPGDALLRINGEKINDEIDFQFYASDDYLELEIEQDGEILIYEVEKDPEETLGLEFEPFKYRSCGNKCIFCFVDQNPGGLRDSLYFKDEDFRLSFLYGNYVTLTNLKFSDAQRIVNQRLTPIYVSVHAVNLDARKKLLGIKKDDQLLKKIEYLAKNRIEIHVQIVLCPGYNDGEVLEDTVQCLSQFYPQVNSIAIVPVGLTRHRENLPMLEPVTSEISRKVIAWSDTLAKEFYSKFGQHFIYLADEFYLQIGQPLPPSVRYDAFSQFENGVGMTRAFLDDFAVFANKLPDRLSKPRSITLVSGRLMEPILRSVVINRLQQVDNLEANLVVVTNHFYGESITVTGLLTGQDICEALKNSCTGELIFLPANCLNFDGIFLDDWTVTMIEDKLERRIKVIDTNFEEFITN